MTSSGPPLQQVYGASLRRHAHHLIAEGYRRLDTAALSQAQEPTITGELIREMCAYLETPAVAPAWAALYSIHDDPPLSAIGKQGRARPRVDIEFERVTVGRRPRLRFEAKRLGRATGHTVAGYLGTDGLGCFLSGKYPTTHGEAGMLGYVQSDDETFWARRIESQMGSELVPQRVQDALEHTYRSHHFGSRDSAALTIYHVLLAFLA